MTKLAILFNQNKKLLSLTLRSLNPTNKYDIHKTGIFVSPTHNRINLAFLIWVKESTLIHLWYIPTFYFIPFLQLHVQLDACIY